MIVAVTFDTDTHVLAPREPTPEMRLAGLSALVQEIERQHKAIDNMDPALAKEIEESIDAVSDAGVVEIPCDSKTHRKYMRIGATMRNSKETDAAYSAMLLASANQHTIEGMKK